MSDDPEFTTLTPYHFNAKEDELQSWCQQLGTFIVDNLDDPPSPAEAPSSPTSVEVPEPMSPSGSTSEELLSPSENPNALQEEGEDDSYDEEESTIALDINKSIANLIAQTSRPGFFGSGDTSSTFSLHKKRKLTQTMKSMIGEAHLRFARGEHALAAELCMEVIKEMPACAEPYHSLSMIYESQPEKSLQYLFIAAFLQPRGFKEWSRIADMSIQFGNHRQALMCIKKAIKADPEDPSHYLKYGQILEDTNDPKAAIRVYSRFTTQFSNDGFSCVTALRRSACIHHKAEDLAKAHEALRTAFELFPTFISSAESNLMLDLCITMKQYVEAWQVLVKFENVQFVPPVPESEFVSREALSVALQSGRYDTVIPKNFAVDLLGKLITVLIHLEAFNLTEKLGAFMSTMNVETYGDLYLDIAESYMVKKNHELALPYLLPLIRSENFSQAAVWLRYAECLFVLVRLEEAVAAYQVVVKLAPNRTLAKLNLAVILQKLGRTEDALETLKQDPDDEFVDPDLMLERCHILYKQQHFKEFIHVGHRLLARHFLEVQDVEDALVIAMASNTGKRQASVLFDRGERGVVTPQPMDKFVEKDANLDQEFTLYLQLCRVFIQMERWDLLCGITYGACASTAFAQVSSIESECEFQTFIAATYSGDDDVLPQHLRVFFARYPLNDLAINLFSVLLHTCDQTRYTRHVSRLVERNSTDTRLILLNAHVNFVSGAYKNALMEYFNLFCQTPEDPLIPLMISSVLLHVLAQKTSQNRIQLSINILAFMRRYAELRGNCQESYYNMGRIFHSIGHFSLAISFYQLVLHTDPPVYEPDPLKQHFFDDGNILDLKVEAAFNLAQIYRRSGAHELARSFLSKYVRI